MEQNDIDKKALAAIEARYAARLISDGQDRGGDFNESETNNAMHKADVADFKTIQDPLLREDAATWIASNMREHPGYRSMVEIEEPEIAQVVDQLDAQNNAKMAAKEDRKAADLDALMQGRVEEARSWTPGQAALRAARDAQALQSAPNDFERDAMKSDMALNARESTPYLVALEKTNPGISNLLNWEERQRLDKEAAGQQAGTPMESIQGARMVYNETPGFAGAEIINPNGTRTSFGGKDAIERFAANAGLTEQEKSTLIAYDAQANGYRTTLSASLEDALSLTDADLARVAVVRAKDTAQARGALGLNAIEQATESQRAPAGVDLGAKSVAWATKAKSMDGFAPGSNGLESDEIFTASQRPPSTVIPQEIEKAYLRVGAKFYDRADSESLVFEDKGNKLETRSDSESVAKSLVRIAEARGWDEIKVSGSEAFRKEVWLEAVQRGMSVKGYRVTEQDKLNLAHVTNKAPLSNDSSEAKQFRGREKAAPSQAQNDPQTPMGQAFTSQPLADVVKKFPQLAGAAAAVSAMERKAEADGLSQAQRAIVSARVRQNVVNSIERGELPKVSVTEQVPVQQERTPSKEYSR